MPTCPSARSFAIAATALLCACFAGEVVVPVGPLGSGQSVEESRREALSFECDPSADPPVLPMRRLARVEYVNALSDLVRASTGAATADAVLAEIQGPLSALPS